MTAAKSTVLLLFMLLGQFPHTQLEAAPTVTGSLFPPPTLLGDLTHSLQDGILHNLSAGILQLHFFWLISGLLT